MAVKIEAGTAARSKEYNYNEGATWWIKELYDT